MENPFFAMIKSLFGGSKDSAAQAGAADGKVPDASEPDDLSCCSGRVHIAYRGVSDDRLYLSENRSKNEVKFFRPIGLRVFCADCRKRLL